MPRDPDPKNTHKSVGYLPSADTPYLNTWKLEGYRRKVRYPYVGWYLSIHAAVFYTRIVEGTFWAIMYATNERELLSPTCLREHGARELAVKQSISTT